MVYSGANALHPSGHEDGLTDMDAEFMSWLVDGESIPTAGIVACEAALTACHAAHPVQQLNRRPLQFPKT